MRSPDKQQRKPASAGESGVGTSPWRKDGPHVYDSDGRVVVSICHTCPTSKDEANLTLAAAAPELRDALEYILKTPGMDFVQTEGVNKCRAALAKAGRAQAGPVEPEE